MEPVIERSFNLAKIEIIMNSKTTQFSNEAAGLLGSIRRNYRIQFLNFIRALARLVICKYFQHFLLLLGIENILDLSNRLSFIATARGCLKKFQIPINSIQRTKWFDNFSYMPL